jgi:hypothetical protein
MNKLDYLKSAKSLWKSIIAKRRWLLTNLKGHVDSAWAKEKLRNLENAKSVIKTADKAKAYIEREETALRFLIPANDHKHHNLLRELIETRLN